MFFLNNRTYGSVPLLSPRDHGHYFAVGVGCLCFEHHVAMGIGFLVDTDYTGSHRLTLFGHLGLLFDSMQEALREKER